MLTDELRSAVRAGELQIPDDQIETHSDLLVGMALECPIPRLLNPELPPNTSDRMAARRNLAVELFVKATAA